MVVKTLYLEQEHRDFWTSHLSISTESTFTQTDYSVTRMNPIYLLLLLILFTYYLNTLEKKTMKPLEGQQRAGTLSHASFSLPVLIIRRPEHLAEISTFIKVNWLKLREKQKQ